MMKAATQRRIDMVLVWSIDRLGRSLQNLVELLNELQSMRIDLMFLQQGMGIASFAVALVQYLFDGLSFNRDLMIFTIVSAIVILASRKIYKKNRIKVCQLKMM